MNDIEFAESISAEIGTLYRSAKENCGELPDYSLSRLRGMCHLLCESIAGIGETAFPEGADLNRKIQLLWQSRQISESTKSKLHQLRINGNVGAHPEEYSITKQRLVEICSQSLEAARTTLEVIYQRRHPGLPLPDYMIASNKGSHLKDMCFSAMINGDPTARHMAGKLFVGKADALRKEVQNSDFPLLGHEHRSLLEQGLFWFKLAADSQHAPSMFEYGAALADGFEGEERRALGENLVYRASELGYADARAFMGDCFLHGSKLFEVDFAEARAQLELAAAEDHPRALANLGAMYEQGKGGPINHEAAFECTRRAAEAGYPQGQYNLFVLYLNGHGVPQDESRALYWLTKAAEQEYPRALLELARFIIDGLVEGKSHADAETLLQRCCISREVANFARYELAQLYWGYAPSYDRLLQAANLLQDCYEREGGEGDLAQKCWDLSPTVVHELRSGLAAHIANAGNEAVLLILRYFDANGHPVKSRAEQNRAMSLDLDRMAKARTQPLGDRVALAGSLFAPHLAQKVRPRQVARIDVPRAKIGRNSPCSCGSGRKFKVCCGRG